LPQVQLRDTIRPDTLNKTQKNGGSPTSPPAELGYEMNVVISFLVAVTVSLAACSSSQIKPSADNTRGPAQAFGPVPDASAIKSIDSNGKHFATCKQAYKYLAPVLTFPSLDPGLNLNAFAYAKDLKNRKVELCSDAREFIRNEAPISLGDLEVSLNNSDNYLVGRRNAFHDLANLTVKLMNEHQDTKIVRDLIRADLNSGYSKYHNHLLSNERENVISVLLLGISEVNFEETYKLILDFDKDGSDAVSSAVECLYNRGLPQKLSGGSEKFFQTFIENRNFVSYTKAGMPGFNDVIAAAYIAPESCR
jgi:hypothetical protein